MPVENEFRYVLHGDPKKLEQRLRSLSDVSVVRIEQGDLSKGVRLRWTRDETSGEVTRELTYKRNIDGHKIEIETAVSKEDFERLWPSCIEKHGKTRYRFGHGEHHWDIDFFGDPDKPHFLRAECEAPSHVGEAPDPHPALAEFVLHEAGKNRGFSSRAVADENYAARLVKTLVEDRRKQEKKARKAGLQQAETEAPEADTPVFRVA